MRHENQRGHFLISFCRLVMANLTPLHWASAAAVDRQLSIISGQLRKRNFIYRMLFKDSY